MPACTLSQSRVHTRPCLPVAAKMRLILLLYGQCTGVTVLLCAGQGEAVSRTVCVFCSHLPVICGPLSLLPAAADLAIVPPAVA